MTASRVNRNLSFEDDTFERNRGADVMLGNSLHYQQLAVLGRTREAE